MMRRRSAIGFIGAGLLVGASGLVSMSAHAANVVEPVGVKVPANQRFALPNGLTIVLVPRKDVPLIAFSGFVRGGALADPPRKSGVASMVAGLLDRGMRFQLAHAALDVAAAEPVVFRLEHSTNADRVGRAGNDEYAPRISDQVEIDEPSHAEGPLERTVYALGLTDAKRDCEEYK